ncbi:MAG TPA: hypothetical protein VLJ88_13005 [Propionibacteriaceae bacterium]|nr:hypothetical protein [Propionibacteriaceae bacterium]
MTGKFGRKGDTTGDVAQFQPPVALVICRVAQHDQTITASIYRKLGVHSRIAATALTPTGQNG